MYDFILFFALFLLSFADFYTCITRFGGSKPPPYGGKYTAFLSFRNSPFCHSGGSATTDRISLSLSFWSDSDRISSRPLGKHIMRFYHFALRLRSRMTVRGNFSFVPE